MANGSGGLESAAGALYRDQDEIRTEAKYTPSRAIRQLEEARERLLQRRQPDTRSRHFAMAEALLAPTRTGQFGEEVGRAAGALKDWELGEQERVTEIDKELLDTEMGLERLQRGLAPRPIGVSNLFPHPDDPEKLARGIEMVDPTTGETFIRYSRDSQGNIPFAAHPLETGRTRDLALNRGLGTGEADRVNDDIEAAIEANSSINGFERSLALLAKVEREGLGTGGWQAVLQNVQEFMGINTEGVADMGALRNALGQNVLLGLRAFPGSISEGERMYMEKLETSLARPTGVNQAILEEGLRIMRRKRMRGIRRARQYNLLEDLEVLGVDPLTGVDTREPDAAPVEAPEPGTSKDNPLVMNPGDPKPSKGTWVQLPLREGETEPRVVKVK